MLWLAHASFIQGGVPEIRLKGGSRFFLSFKAAHAAIVTGVSKNVHFDTPSIVLGRAYSKTCAIMPSKRSAGKNMK